MKITVPGYTTLTGTPQTIFSLLHAAGIATTPPPAGEAESALRSMAQQKIINIEEE